MEDGTVISLLGTEGFSGLVQESSWPVLGGEVAVYRKNPPQSWRGKIEAFHRTTRFVAEWTLKSGQTRMSEGYDDRIALGDVFPIRDGANAWEATVTYAQTACRVAVGYRIKSGARRTRNFYPADPIGAFFAPQPDGSVNLLRIE
jgi:hypothetical protein